MVFVNRNTEEDHVFEVFLAMYYNNSFSNPEFPRVCETMDEALVYGGQLEELAYDGECVVVMSRDRKSPWNAEGF